MEFCFIIKKLRKEQGLSQSQLGKILKCAPSTIGMWEQGMRKPDLYGLIKLSDYFNCTIDYLVGR